MLYIGNVFIIHQYEVVLRNLFPCKLFKSDASVKVPFVNIGNGKVYVKCSVITSEYIVCQCWLSKRKGNPFNPFFNEEIVSTSSRPSHKFWPFDVSFC